MAIASHQEPPKTYMKALDLIPKKTQASKPNQTRNTKQPNNIFAAGKACCKCNGGSSSKAPAAM
jgi:hypothetical protein